MAIKYTKFNPPVEIKANIRQTWLDMLASGQYIQTDGKLFDGVGFCCLGVLCDIHSGIAPKNRRQEWVNNGDVELEYDGETGIPSLAIGKWAFPHLKKLHQEDSVWNPKKFEYEAVYPDTLSGQAEKFMATLAIMNDTGKSFTQIAKYIEENSVGV